MQDFRYSHQFGGEPLKSFKEVSSKLKQILKIINLECVFVCVMKMLTTSAALGGEQLLMGCLQSVPSIPLARDTYSSRCTQGPSALVREASFLVFNGLHASHRGMQKAFDSESILLGHLTDTRKARCGVG